MRRRSIVSGLLAIGFLVITAKVGVFNNSIASNPYSLIIHKFCHMFHAIPIQIGLQHGTLFFLSEATLYVLPYYVLIWFALTLLIYAIISVVNRITLGKKA